MFILWVQPEAGPHFEAELEINDFPQHARWKVGAPSNSQLWGPCVLAHASGGNGMMATCCSGLLPVLLLCWGAATRTPLLYP